MSLHPGLATEGTARPTPALVTSVLLAAGLLLAAVLLHRTAPALLATPFVAHGLRALGRRPVGRWRLAPVPPGIGEGQAVLLRVQAAPDELVTLALAPGPLQHSAPAHGAATGVGAAGVRVEPVRWGRHRLGPGVVTAGDPAGAWRVQGSVESVPVRVRPAGELMLGGSGVRLPLGSQGEHVSSRRGEGTEIAEVRQYRPGDRLRRITWRTSSRSDELHVVDALTERDTDVLVLLDSLAPALELGDEPESSLDVGVRATVALARHYLAFGDRVGVHDLGHRLRDLPLGSGPRQLAMLHEALSGAAREPGQGRPAGLRPTRAPRAGTLVFVCSPLLDQEVLAEVGRLRVLGVELVVVDTLPPGLGRIGPVGPRDGLQGLAQAWMLRRLQRQAVVESLQAAGIPVAAWQGPASLAAVLQAMEQARHAPRMVRR